MARGSEGRLLIGEETTWGTQATSFQILYFVREGLQGEIENIVDETISSRRAMETPRGGRITAGGGIDVNLSNVGAHGTLIKHALGAVTTTQELDANNNPTGFYIHEITGADSLPAGLTIEKGFTDTGIYFVYTGGKINNMTIECTNDGLVTASFDVMAKDEQSSNTSVSATPTDNGHRAFVYWEGEIQIDGAVAGKISSYSITVDNQLSDEFFIGDRYRGIIVEGRRQVTGSLQAYFEDLTLYNKFRNETALSLLLRITYDADNYIEIYTPNVKLTGRGSPVIDSAGVVYQNFDWQAFYDTTLGSDVKITIKNTLSAI